MLVGSGDWTGNPPSRSLGTEVDAAGPGGAGARATDVSVDDERLEALLEHGESDRVEYKESAQPKDKIRQAVCAFANDLPDHRAPGVVFVGLQDDGTCANLEITDELLRDLASLRDDGKFSPMPTMAVRRAVVCGCTVAVVIVQPSTAPPIRVDGRTWIRIGPRRGTATAEEEQRLIERRRARDLPFELRPVSTASIDDLDLDFFRTTFLPAAVAPEWLEQNHRSPEEQLASLRFVGPDGEPTVLGLLVIGREPLSFVPGAYVQFLRIDGSELTEPIKDQKMLDGPLPEQLRAVDELIKVHVSVRTEVEGHALEQRMPDLPVEALKQVLYNAVMHRQYEGTNAPVRWTWYSDRVEVLSPGGPFGQVTPETFGVPGVTDYRNPHLADAMKTLGYVQKFGMGIALAERALENNGNPPLELEVQPSTILATIRARP